MVFTVDTVANGEAFGHTINANPYVLLWTASTAKAHPLEIVRILNTRQVESDDGFAMFVLHHILEVRDDGVLVGHDRIRSCVFIGRNTGKVDFLLIFCIEESA